MHLPEVMRIFLDTADTEVIKKYYGTGLIDGITTNPTFCLLYTSPSPRDNTGSRMPSSA